MTELTRPMSPRAAPVAALLIRTWPRIRCTLALAALAVVLAWPALAAAQRAPCLPRVDAIVKLQRQYHERQVGMGVVKSGNSVVELFVGESGSWTILITRVDGISCVAAVGESWSAIDADPDRSL